MNEKKGKEINNGENGTTNSAHHALPTTREPAGSLYPRYSSSVVRSRGIAGIKVHSIIRFAMDLRSQELTDWSDILPPHDLFHERRNIRQRRFVLESGQIPSASEFVDFRLRLLLRGGIGEHGEDEGTKSGDGRVGAADVHGPCSLLDVMLLVIRLFVGIVESV